MIFLSPYSLIGFFTFFFSSFSKLIGGIFYNTGNRHYFSDIQDDAFPISTDFDLKNALRFYPSINPPFHFIFYL